MANAVSLSKDVRFHTGIPLVGTVTEMDAAFKTRGFHGNISHVSPSVPLSDTHLVVWSGMSLVGLMTQSRTLVPVPGRLCSPLEAGLYPLESDSERWATDYKSVSHRLAVYRSMHSPTLRIHTIFMFGSLCLGWHRGRFPVSCAMGPVRPSPILREADLV